MLISFYYKQTAKSTNFPTRVIICNTCCYSSYEKVIWYTNSIIWNKGSWKRTFTRELLVVTNKYCTATIPHEQYLCYVSLTWIVCCLNLPAHSWILRFNSLCNNLKFVKALLSTNTHCWHTYTHMHNTPNWDKYHITVMYHHSRVFVNPVLTQKSFQILYYTLITVAIHHKLRSKRILKIKMYTVIDYNRS